MFDFIEFIDPQKTRHVSRLVALDELSADYIFLFFKRNKKHLRGLLANWFEKSYSQRSVFTLERTRNTETHDNPLIRVSCFWKFKETFSCYIALLLEPRLRFVL